MLCSGCGKEAHKTNVWVGNVVYITCKECKEEPNGVGEN